jgi:serine/threonine-protein kinase PknG
VTVLQCARDGCAGVVEDGWCTVCGLAPPAGAKAAPQQAAVAPADMSADPSAGSGPQSSSAGRARSAMAGSGVISARGGLGAGLIDVPPVPAIDPAGAVLTDPQVAESKRFCSGCEQPVGRGRAGRAGRTNGFCGNCRARFDFRPRLERGELIAGQYEVLGCLAHGGLGWIYLARDKNVSDRWVVLKGLLNAGDADAQAAAVAERRFLAEVEHPSIVRIYNFVQHPDRETGDPTGYIVMEYVGGQSLRQIVLQRRAAGGSVSVVNALAYAIEVLPALGYLHGLGLVYCDFKLDNVIQVEEQLKLIDLGGVRRIDDDDSPIYGTVGYQAPEIGAAGPSPGSDLYTVGRALALLAFEFAGYTSTYRHSLPDPATVPVLAEHESFGRLLRRATSADPQRRFTSAADMAEQLTGVLREVLCASDGRPRPAFSRRFSPELQAVGADAAGGDPELSMPTGQEIAAALPVPLVDSNDPAAGFLATLSALGPEQLDEALQAAVSAGTGAAGGIADGVEAYLALARARIALGNAAGARWALSQLTGHGHDDWRVTWYQGLAAILAGRPDDARASFDAVCGVLPGELAPKLALGLVAEAAADLQGAARYLGTVWTTDRSFVSAAFGLARVRLAAGDRAGAVTVLGMVPETSSHFVAAQVAAVRARIGAADPASLSAADLADAASRLGRLRVDAETRHVLTAEILRAGLVLVQESTAPADTKLLDYDLTDADLRRGLERSYRALARLSATAQDRYALVDLANDVRPRTLT